jgi:HAD superfamily hydrolase (TIGR01509 family)
VQERELKTGLVTNAPRKNVGAVLPALRLGGYFDAVVPIVPIEEAGPGKPDPAPYRAVLKKLGADPGEALAFEDSVSGIASAVGAGIPTVGIASTQNPERLREAGVFMVAKDFTDPDLRALIGDR